MQRWLTFFCTAHADSCVSRATLVRRVNAEDFALSLDSYTHSQVWRKAVGGWLLRGHEGRFSRDSLPVFPAGGHREQLWHVQGCPLFVSSADHDVVHPARCPEGWFLERLAWRVTCPNHASFRLLRVATDKEVDLAPRTQSLALCSKYEIRRSFPMHFVSKARIRSPPPPPVSKRSMFHSRRGGRT